ncbi:MAG: hypothetical protein LBJ24_06310 [Treponema sp.]|jgi:hypothetical protein|nr:hypothetical protein [Treponema sp.]
MFQETDRKIREMTARTDKQIGELGNRFGELAEHLVRPTILAKFKALGYSFTKVYSNVEFFDRAWRALTEIDIWLENGESVMVVEIKSRLRRRDVEEQIGRMELLRAYFNDWSLPPANSIYPPSTDSIICNNQDKIWHLLKKDIVVNKTQSMTNQQEETERKEPG